MTQPADDRLARSPARGARHLRLAAADPAQMFLDFTLHPLRFLDQLLQRLRLLFEIADSLGVVTVGHGGADEGSRVINRPTAERRFALRGRTARARYADQGDCKMLRSQTLESLQI